MFELSELIEEYTYDPNFDTSEFDVSNETTSIATELKNQVGFAGSALARTLETDAPPAQLCLPAFCQTAEKRSSSRIGGPEAPPYEVDLGNSETGRRLRALQGRRLGLDGNSSEGAPEAPQVKVFVTANASQLKSMNGTKAVEATLLVSAGQDFAGAGSTSEVALSGAQVIFTMFQDGKEMPVNGLKEDPVQITAPKADPEEDKGKCTGQPDPRNQMSSLFEGDVACAESSEAHVGLAIVARRRRLHNADQVLGRPPPDVREVCSSMGPEE